MASKNGKGPEMATFKNETYGTKFSMPARPTVRQQMRWTSAISMGPVAAAFERVWYGMKPLITDWQCEIIANPFEFDLDESDDYRAHDIIVWAAEQASSHMASLRDVKKSTSKKS